MAPSHEALRLGRRSGGIVAPCLQDSFHLPALSSSVAEARRRSVLRLSHWGVPQELRDNAELVVSELVTNAVRHTSSEEFGCLLRLAVGRLRIEVTDRSAVGTEPQARAVCADQEGGRGLMLVDAVSESWGVRPTPGGHGKLVWALLA